MNPYVNGVRKFGQKELRKGEMKFFLQPGEKLESDTIHSVIVLGEDEALVLKAIANYKDEDGKEYLPGTIWMKVGPCDFIPPIEVQVINSAGEPALEKRKVYPLDKNEGIYVRDKRTGEVKMIKGQTYLLSSNEELWEKQLSDVVEKLISEGVDQMEFAKLSRVIPRKRDKTKVVTFRASKGSAVQLYDFKTGENRIVFGPELIMLGPYEEISVLSLSGGYPV